jgi:glucosamine--fructose-6-phosphate aminotransferase (isomerizing)
VRHSVNIFAGREIGVASTKSFTSQIITLNLLAHFFSNLKTKKNNIETYSKKIKNTSLKINTLLDNSKINNTLLNYSKKIKNESSMFVLGKKQYYTIAREGALKLKEISYIHSEGFSASALKHGPFSLLKHNTPVVMLINNDANYSKMLSIYEEIKSRNANILVMTNVFDFPYLTKNIIYLDTVTTIDEILYTIPLQLLSYYLAIEKGLDPDYPRNLAKVVSV